MTSLDDIAMTIDRDGFEALAPQLIDGVLTLAAAAHASPVLVEVLADDHEPAPVRERAFALLARQIDSAGAAAVHADAHPSNSGASPSPACSSPRKRSRRSRLPVPARGADWRSNWPGEVPVVR